MAKYPHGHKYPLHPQGHKGHKWGGVVMVVRPDPSKPNNGRVAVMSARTVELGGRRAIRCELPYAMVKGYFGADDGDHVFVDADYLEGHLQLHHKIPQGLKDWVETSFVTNQEDIKNAPIQY